MTISPGRSILYCNGHLECSNNSTSIKTRRIKMDIMLVAVFDTEPQAYQGLIALQKLHRVQEIKLHSTAVIAKDASGTIHLKKAAKKKRVGSRLDLLVRGLPDLLQESVGLPGDILKAEANADFVQLVSQTLEPGKVALLAEIDETSMDPVDTKLVELGGHVFR